MRKLADVHRANLLASPLLGEDVKRALISEESVETIIDMLMEELVRRGFDSNYRLLPEWKFIDDIIYSLSAQE
jgi:hypothetical protein